MISIYSHFGYFDLTTAERFRLIKQAGFDGVLIWLCDDWENHNFLYHLEAARENDLFVENIHTPECEPERLFDHLSTCHKFQVPTMIVHPDLGTLEIFKRLVDRAEQLEVNIAFENLLECSSLFGILDHIDSPRARFCYDSGHHNISGPQEPLIERYGDRLGALHLNDNNGVKNTHLLPFDGTFDWHAIAAKLSATGYTGSIALECKTAGYEERGVAVEEFLETAYEKATRLQNNTHLD